MMSALENVKSAITEGYLTEAHVTHLLAAYREDSASASNWLISILKLIRKRLEDAQTITISHNAKLVILETPQQLTAWITELFPEIAQDC